MKPIFLALAMIAFNSAAFAADRVTVRHTHYPAGTTFSGSASEIIIDVGFGKINGVNASRAANSRLRWLAENDLVKQL